MTGCEGSYYCKDMGELVVGGEFGEEVREILEPVELYHGVINKSLKKYRTNLSQIISNKNIEHI